ncbi:sensor histidine kinase [Neobacillus piezotolerans]|uniref:sensor histidine kinase n=1 Tax=Neobacillus piezotolerans TaxID=2259171 RepID=UPI001FE9D9AA|nr:ATP-binding protein [Neobacillus piezotolerans]
MGLIQLGSYKEAIEFISKEMDHAQGFIEFLMREVPDPIIAGFILGKASLASELKIKFNVDQSSSFKDVPASISRDNLITIIGNLINNAFEAVKENNEKGREVSLFLTDLGKDLIIEIEDNGKGIRDKDCCKIFEQGFSTKASSNNQGIGLSLVKNAVDSFGGTITFSTVEGEGTLFTVALPKRGKKNGHPEQH